MSSGVKTIIYPVRTREQAKAVFGALLGAGPTINSPYYVQFETGDLRTGLDPNGHARRLHRLGGVLGRDRHPCALPGAAGGWCE